MSIHLKRSAFAFILFLFVGAMASAHPLIENLDKAMSYSSDQKGIEQAMEKLLTLGEENVTRLLLETYPPETFLDYTHTNSIYLVNALSSYGGPESTGFVVETLEQIKDTKSPLKASLIYSLMKAGVRNKDRVASFLESYRQNQNDPDAIHAIDILMEGLGAMLEYGENGDPNDVDIDERVSEISEKIKRPWYQCSSKMWSFNPNPQALFIDPETQRAWHLSQSGLAELDSIPSNLAFDFKFDFSRYENKPAIAINLRKTFGSDPYYKGSYALYLALHEGFHQIFQAGDKWVDDEGFQSGSHYPPKVKPRYYRRMIYQYLKSVLQGRIERRVGLGKAKYWYNKWKSEFPDELLQNVDRHEGTAMFYDVLGVAIGHLGCQATKNEVTNFINENYDKFFQTPQDFRDEGYNIGALSSMQLWLLQSPWVNEVAQGKSPLESLFSRYSEIADTDHSRVRAEVAAKERKEFETNRKNLHGDLENFLSKDHVRVSIPRSWYNERLPLLGMVLPQKMPDDSIFITTEGYYSYNYDDKGDFVKALGSLPLFKLKSHPCSGPVEFVVIDKSNFDAYQDDQISAKSQYVDFHANGNLVTDRQGVEWFCSQ